jgi:hypothetical protein
MVVGVWGSASFWSNARTARTAFVEKSTPVLDAAMGNDCRLASGLAAKQDTDWKDLLLE